MIVIFSSNFLLKVYKNVKMSYSNDSNWSKIKVRQFSNCKMSWEKWNSKLSWISKVPSSSTLTKLYTSSRCFPFKHQIIFFYNLQVRHINAESFRHCCFASYSMYYYSSYVDIDIIIWKSNHSININFSFCVHRTISRFFEPNTTQ